MPEPTLAGRAALISGGSSGINLGIAKALAAAGASVAVFGRDGDKARRAAAEIEAAAAPLGRALGLAGDERDPDAVARVVGEAADAFGPLGIVVAGAAGNFPAAAVDLTPKGFRTVVEIDLMGTYNVFRLAFDRLATPGASLIAITAPQAVNPTMRQAHVCAAKAGVNMLVRTLALEWGPAGVRVNGISPGPIAGTEGMARMAPGEAALERVARRTPLRRLGEVREVADLALFLCSDAAAYITGGIYNCDGGVELGDASGDALTRRR